MRMPVILASSSPTRAALLRAAGVTAKQIAPGIDEDSMRQAMQAEDIRPPQQAMMLAGMKAQKVSKRQAGLVIGADQILACDDRVFGKPADMEAALSHLRALRGRTHSLHTAVLIHEDGTPVWRHAARADLQMCDVSDAALTAYLAAAGDSVLSSPGAYRIEESGIQLFKAIEGDYFSILGLPLLPLLSFLRIRGVILA